MKEWRNNITEWFVAYCDSFKGLSEEDIRNFTIKKEHSLRVAELSVYLAGKLEMNEKEQRTSWFIGLFHDIGRFQQLKEYGTFDDSKSVDHAEYSIQVLKETGILKKSGEDIEIVETAILNHNKKEIKDKLPESTMQFARILRDADKLDILKVLTDYYSSRNVFPNHTLTWELPAGSVVSKAVSKEILSGKLVSRKNVVSELDVKIMQMSWVYDLNFRASFEYMLKHRFLESIFNALPKNDLVINIYREVKMYTGNKILSN